MADIIFSELPGKQGDLGLIVLNRPKALNALTEHMFLAMHDKLHKWEKSPKIKGVVIRGAGDRAFCAGGDIRHVYEQRDEPLEKKRKIFWEEYRLNQRIFHFSKPYIAFLDGITMGGGAGVSINGSHRIATEKLSFAMPETTIGFFPDVGASYFLPRCPGKMGLYLGLSGRSINAADACFLKLTNYYIPSNYLDEVLQALIEKPFINSTAHVAVNEILESFSASPGEADLVDHCDLIGHCFARNTIEEILQALDESDDEWCRELAVQISSKSPTSLKVVLEEMKRGEVLDFDACMQMEYRLVNHFLQGHDFYEGIRAAIIDKDRDPHWKPSELSEVTAAMVDNYFRKLNPDKELHFG
jgi:enoyl-CoA hydratase